MSLFENPENLQLLQNLLNPQRAEESESDLEDEADSLLKKNFNPGSIGPQTNSKNTSGKKVSKLSPFSPVATSTSKQPKQPQTLEEWQLMHEQEDAEILDNRKCPSYTLTYRQAVGTEDVFLQLGNRSNASASCEDLVVDIMLPDDDTPADKMQLNITATELDLSTPVYHLKLPLVHRVNVNRCHAKYHAEQRQLTLTLRLQRELDFVNF